MIRNHFVEQVAFQEEVWGTGDRFPTYRLENHTSFRMFYGQVRNSTKHAEGHVLEEPLVTPRPPTPLVDSLHRCPAATIVATLGVELSGSNGVRLRTSPVQMATRS